MLHTDRKGVVAVDITRNGAPDGPLTRSRATTAPAASLRLSFGAEPRAVLDARGELGPLVPPAHGPLPGERTTAPNVGAAAYVSTLGCDLNELENRHLVEGRPSNGAKLVPAAAGGVKLDVERELVAAIAAGRWVLLVEGEKDVLAVESVGGVATCWAGGVSGWRHCGSAGLDPDALADVGEGGRDAPQGAGSGCAHPSGRPPACPITPAPTRGRGSRVKGGRRPSRSDAQHP